MNTSVQHSRRSSTWQKRAGKYGHRADTIMEMAGIVGEGKVIGLDVMLERDDESSDDSEKEERFGLRDTPKQNPEANENNTGTLGAKQPNQPQSPSSILKQSNFSIPEDKEFPLTHRDSCSSTMTGLGGDSYISNNKSSESRRESGLDLNQLLSSCPNLSLKEM